MSLRIWLPLTKDLRNQGLDDATVTNNGATFNSTGKLGGCYSFDGSTSFINTNINIPNFALDKTYSITCWVYPSGVSGQKPIVGIGPDWSWTIFQQDTDLRFVQWDESGSRWGDPAISGVFSANTWVHIGIVWNQGVLLFYKNGEKIYEWTAPTSRTIKVSSDTVKIGGNIYAWGNNYFNGKLNDVRIYDHCLSPLEVKQISQGLILHYPLNRNGWGQENLLKGTDTGSGWSYSTFDVSKGVFTRSTTSTSESYVQFNGYNVPVEAGVTYTLSCYAKSNGFVRSMDMYKYNSSIQNIQHTSYDLTIDYKLYTFTFTPQATENVTIRFDNNGSTTSGTEAIMYIKRPKLEKGSKATPWCPNSSDALATTMGLNDNVEYDVSGFGNNGTRTGIFSWTSDTPRYNVSTSFNGSAKIERDSLMGEIYTLSCWAKTTKDKTTSQMMVVDSNSQMAIAFYNGTIIGVYGTTRSTGSKCTLSGSNYKENEWNHFVVVKTSDDGKRNIYCNGELLTPSSDDYWSSTSNNFVIGARNTSTPYYFYGEISDVRVYATALSADDALDLYHTSAYIDDNNNLYVNELSEVTT